MGTETQIQEKAVRTITQRSSCWSKLASRRLPYTMKIICLSCKSKMRCESVAGAKCVCKFIYAIGPTLSLGRQPNEILYATRLRDVEM